MQHKYLLSAISSATVSARCQHHILSPQSFHCHYCPIHFLFLLWLTWKAWDHLDLLYPMSLWSLHQVPPTLTKTYATTAWKRPPRYHMHHILVPHFTAVPLIGRTCSSWRCNRRHKYEQHFEFTSKAIYHSTTIIVCCLSKNNVSFPIQELSIIMY